MLTQKTPETRRSDIQSQIAALRSQHRSTIHFREWKPDLFYYLFVLAGAALVYFLSPSPWWGLRKLAVMGFGFGLLWYLPGIANRLRLWLFFRRPNRLLDRKIALLLAELKRLQNKDRPVA